MTPPVPIDVTAYCRNWVDSNDHLFTIEHIELDDDGIRYKLIGTSSGCTCQFMSHDGPHERDVDSLDELNSGEIFGFTASPRTSDDLAALIRVLLELEHDEWEAITDQTLEGNFDDALPVGIELVQRGALWLFAQTGPGRRSLLTIRAMAMIGYDDPVFIADAVLGGMTAGDVLMIAQTDPEQQAALRESWRLLEALNTVPVL